MAARLIDGAKIASEIREGVKRKAGRLSFRPGLATVLVGDDPASRMYVSMKQRACGDVGFHSESVELAGTVSESEVVSVLGRLNGKAGIHGILVQLPLPKSIDVRRVLEALSPLKDVDGLHPLTMGRLVAGDESLAPATPKGVMRILDECKIGLEGREVVIVNHSSVVGKPLALMMLNRNATVTVCHKYTRDLRSRTLGADVLVSAAGVPCLIKSDMVKDGVVVVDAGISKVGGKTVGDVDFDSVSKKASWITPVPGGVGPMTIAMLLENTLSAAVRQNS
jgi:methylenetetrahydrofolate dehydrogenase (NADP+)/methenyltetrahydrofolate cyclohydrolase